MQQLSRLKNQLNQDFIDQVIDYTNAYIDGVNFAEKKYSTRFFLYNSHQFQVMQKLPGNSIVQDQLNHSIIEQTAHNIALFHTGIQDFDVSSFRKVNYFKKLKRYEKQAGVFIEKSKNKDITEVYHSMSNISQDLHEDSSLPI